VITKRIYNEPAERRPRMREERSPVVWEMKTSSFPGIAEHDPRTANDRADREIDAAGMMTKVIGSAIRPISVMSRPWFRRCPG